MNQYSNNLKSLTNRETVVDFFRKTLNLYLHSPYIVALPFNNIVTQKLPQILDWCNLHLLNNFDYAYLVAIEDTDGEYLLSSMVPESAPTGVFFAFICPDEELLFRLTWKGEVY